ncbi:MAG: hypothetical protein OEL79_03940 [Chromatiales bacterium]|nr:hypothetical protein [Chromatiales bacterium]
MRPSEEYVLSTLVDQFGGRYIEGEDPPDGYILNGDKRIAVEVSTLVENIQGENGKQYSRMNDDAPAQNLAKKIESDIENNIPEGMHVFLTICAPIKKIKKTQTLVGNEIITMIQTGVFKLEREFFGNDISINIFTGWGDYTPKVGLAISNRYSSDNLGKNTKIMLSERIEIKNKKRNVQPNNSEYWLALFNDYWIANEESYQLAYKNLNIEHNFDKILIVNGNRQAYVLHKT